MSVVRDREQGLFLADDDEELAGRVHEAYRVDAVEVLWDRLEGGPRQELTEQARDARSADGTPAYRTGLLMQVPFEGDPVLLTHHADDGLDTPDVELAATWQGLLMHYATAEHDVGDFRRWRDTQQRRVDTVVERANEVASAFNEDLRQVVLREIAVRRLALARQSSFLEAVGLARRPDAPAVAPMRRRVIRPPRRMSARSSPDPVLAEEAHDDVLRTLSSIGVAFERSPRTFARLTEPEIRDFVLVVLNATYEGEAHGEAFNHHGKTDVLIRRDNRNVFVAELKFWDGAASVQGGIDQLLSYLSYRDTRGTLVVFVRDRVDQTAAVHDCLRAAAEHPTVIGGPRRRSNTRQDLVAASPDDPERRIHLAVMVFVVPSPPADPALDGR